MWKYQKMLEIKWGTFYKCEDLIGISLPDTITETPLLRHSGSRSLQNCEFSVASFIDETYITIGKDAFFEFIKLVKVDLSCCSVYSRGQG